VAAPRVRNADLTKRDVAATALVAAIAVAASLAVAGCAGLLSIEEGTLAQDAGSPGVDSTLDTGDSAEARDSGVVDAPTDSVADTADTNVADTNAADTNVADTNVADTNVADTNVADTNVADTNVADTNVADTNVADTIASTNPSCAGGLQCGSVSCCDAKLVPGSTAGTLPMGRSAAGADQCPSWGTTSCSGFPNELPEHSATVSDFKLDTFEVTVGRFRSFVAAYPASKPSAGAGANPKIGAPSGWVSGWPLPLDQPALIASLKCSGATWTDGSSGGNENKPINCVDWYTAFAFCAWDGGRLPSEAEWEYAAAGGSENRLLPWGGTVLPDCAHANILGCAGAPVAVGTTPPGASRWGHQDFGGNVWEWTLDEYSSVYSSSLCADCANTAFSANRVWRGGNLAFNADTARVTYRGADSPTRRIDVLGLRCARSP
jgi:formylglycine-generating enzyme required for sulfatase activity